MQLATWIPLPYTLPVKMELVLPCKTLFSWSFTLHLKCFSGTPALQLRSLAFIWIWLFASLFEYETLYLLQLLLILPGQLLFLVDVGHLALVAHQPSVVCVYF